MIDVVETIGRATSLARATSDRYLLARSTTATLKHMDPTDPEWEQVTAEALALCDEVGDRRLTLATTGNMGYAGLVAGALDSAAEHLYGALSAARDLEAHNDEAICLIDLGLLDLLRGHHATALHTFRTASKKAQLLGNRMLIAYSLLGVAMTLGDTGEPNTAAQLHEPPVHCFGRSITNPKPCSSA